MSSEPRYVRTTANAAATDALPGAVHIIVKKVAA